MIKILLALSVFLTGEIHAQQNYNKLNVKELDVTSRVNVISTTKSSKPCPVMTLIQRDAIATPLTGSCVYNSTDLQLNIYDGTLWQSAGGGGIENWETATAYDVDDVVIESNKIYQCDIAHTSGIFATDLAANRWVELSAQGNLTGVISSTGLATTITSQTGTGSTFVVQNTPTLTTPNIGAATGTSLALAGNISAYNYDKDNMFVNGNIENPLSTEWTCTVGTCTRTTVAGEFSKDTAALKVALTAQAMNVSQTVTTPSGIQKQGYVGFIYRIPASGIVTPTVTITVDSVLQVTVPTDKLIMDGLFHSLEVPIVFGSTDVKIAFLSGSSTGSVFFDGVYLKQGIGLQNLQGDNVYSAVYSTTGVVSTISKSFSGNAVVTDTSLFTIPLTGFTVPPVCQVNVVDSAPSNGTYARIETQATATSIAIRTYYLAPALTKTAYPFNLSCQKSGNDYLAASSQVYSQSSSNYSRRAYTPTFTGFGTVTGVSCYESRIGEFNEIDCRFTAGTPTATEARVSLPNGNVSGSTISTLEIAGTYTRGSSDGNHGGFSLREAGVAYVTFSPQSTFSGNASTGLAKANGDVTVGTGVVFQFTARVPISGWTNANVIVGSFANQVTTPNIDRPYIQGASLTTTSGTISNNFGSFLSSCTAANPSVCTFTVPFKTAPVCWGQISSNVGVLTPVYSETTTTVTIRSILSATGTDEASIPVKLFCLGER